jgi:hypothetical protein
MRYVKADELSVGDQIIEAGKFWPVLDLAIGQNLVAVRMGSDPASSIKQYPKISEVLIVSKPTDHDFI